MLSLVVSAQMTLKAASGTTPSDLEESVAGQGRIVLTLTFDGAGKVTDCRLVRSNAPVELEASTVEYVRSHWNSPIFAGTRVTVPIVFEGNAGSIRWNGDFPLPPNPFPFDTQKHAMKLRLKFNDHGWVSHVQAEQTSGIQLADDQTGAWIQAHWHHAAFANKEVVVPLEFVRSLPPPRRASSMPAAPHPHKPAPESVAIPAMKVE
jgi:TonB family protein